MNDLGYGKAGGPFVWLNGCGSVGGGVWGGGLTPLLAGFLDVLAHAVKLWVQLRGEYGMGAVL